jgi:uncharacterized protein YxeA
MKNFLRLALVVIIALSLVGTATAGQHNALSKANSYLSISAFSKSGLKKQLKFDGFSGSEAGWAVNHVRVSWKAQAVKKAKSYLDITSFSKSGLIHQLEFDGFTHSQAVYGVNKAYH